MRIKELITKAKILSSLLKKNSLDSFFKEMYGVQSGEFVRGQWGLKALTYLFSSKKNSPNS